MFKHTKNLSLIKQLLLGSIAGAYTRFVIHKQKDSFTRLSQGQRYWTFKMLSPSYPKMLHCCSLRKTP